MVRNRNGYWMSPKFFAMYAPDDGGGSGGDAGAGGDGTPGGDDGNDGSGDGGDGDADKGGNDKAALEAKIEKMMAEMARQKAALDKATKEAGDARKALKAKMTQEEIDAANKEEADKKAAEELEELRKKVAKAENTKAVMSKLSLDEDAAGQIAESLVGCENIENALLLIQKAWTAKEKALKLEYGKIPPPGAGGSGGEDAAEQAVIEKAKQLGRNRADSNKTVAESMKGYIR